MQPSESQEHLSIDMPQVGWRPISQVAARSPAADSLQSPAGLDITQSPPEQVGTLSRLQAAPHSFQCPVSADAQKLIDPSYRNIDEFKYTTYTPVLCSPEEMPLPENQYSLRQQRFKRKTELLIAVTMYNESDEFLIRTLSAIFKNIKFFCELSKQPGDTRGSQLMAGRVNEETFVASPGFGRDHGDVMWDEMAWQKIVLVIIADGRQKVHPRVMKMLQVMGIVQPEIILTESSDPLDSSSEMKPVQAHLFEYTCQAVLDDDLSIKSSRQGVVPVQTIFCLKEKNMKKLNSHKWLFRGICEMLDPRVCVLIDVGTRPKTSNAIYHLWKCFDRDPNIAGACGEICVMMGKGCTGAKSYGHPLIASQNFEYKISNILDKTLESCFGYISVLPGAFSAYRWEALQDTDAERGPLIAYFKGETPKPKGNVFTSNMYLAEDRILCLELVAKYGCKYKLHYVKDARAETDVPSSIPEFISQRRRWLNGTFFCQIFALVNLGRFWKTKHSFFRKLGLTFQFLYFFCNLVFSWFAIANFYLAFYLITKQTFAESPPFDGKEIVFEIVRLVYWAIVIMLFICSMGNRPQGARLIFVGSFFILAAIMMYLTGITVSLIVQTFQKTTVADAFRFGSTASMLIISISSTYGVYLISSLLCGEAGHVMGCLFQYMLLLPSYINTLQIFAFTNTHDVSWGTKGDNKASTGEHSPKKAEKKGVNGEESKAQLSTEPPSLPQEQLTNSYRGAMREMSVRPEEEEQRLDANTKRDDYYRNFRTWFVLFWVMSNGLLVAVVSSNLVADKLAGTTTGANIYLSIIMYSVAVIALVRFAGCCVYLMLRSSRGY